METINQLLDEKGHEVFAVSPESPVYDAIEMMADKGVGALLVMEGDNLAGVVSERDYARKVILKGKSSRSTQVRDIMTAEVVSVSPHDTVDQCLAVMTQNKIRHLPVLEDGGVVGVLSIGDLVKSVIDDQKHQIQSLEQYISG
ncbi:MAG: CBS domain-containing protein [Xanthomonadales bacterium]|nr:CBS domain-containing protein [Xanthomonadales bacterium]